MIGDDSLIAYLDGELAPAERDKIEEALGADLSLAHRLAQHRATMEAVRQTF
ncbi:anti-sigma factor, partial [Xylella fastidiosa subsp. multiplex]|nr:anti-sigma factor [Xylella fastidiosa subsp. multiplex]